MVPMPSSTVHSPSSKPRKALLARSFAVHAHGDQRYGRHPYTHHLDAVAELARHYGDEAEAVAYLHDVKEDVEGMTLAHLRGPFGEEVADAVDLLSDPPGATRKERKAQAYSRLVVTTNRLALIVKPCDRLANMRACLADGNARLLEVYRSEHSAFRIAAYRHGLCDEIWQELDEIVDKPMSRDEALRPIA
jgi:(p)ppGpp synthase/HD superfamily hydrolase